MSGKMLGPCQYQLEESLASRRLAYQVQRRDPYSSAEGSLVLSGESPGITGRNDRTGIPHSEVEIDPEEVKQV
jgi:hypothetical protein